MENRIQTTDLEIDKKDAMISKNCFTPSISKIKILKIFTCLMLPTF